MLISVVIPSYNRADVVGQAIDSIISQKVAAEIEIVIGDDCSTDHAREVLLDYQKRFPDIIRLIFHEQNKGLGANWATCVKACQGQYICNCDNDDFWHDPDKLQVQLDYMESHPQSNVLITNHRTFNRATGEIREEKAHIDRTIPLQQAFFRGRESFCNATIMYRADFLKEHLPLDDFISHHFMLQDWTAWIILSAYTDFDILDRSTATMCLETQSITRPTSVEALRKRMEQEKDCYQYCCALFPDDLPYSETGWNSYVDSLLLSKAYQVGDYKQAYLSANNLSGHIRNWKTLFAQNRLTFGIGSLLIRMKRSASKGISKIMNKANRI